MAWDSTKSAPSAQTAVRRRGSRVTLFSFTFLKGPEVCSALRGYPLVRDSFRTLAIIGIATVTAAAQVVYDGGVWQPTAAYQVAGNYLTIVPPYVRLLDGRILVHSGGSQADSGSAVFDPTTGAWTSTGKMNTIRGSYTATLLPNGNVLAAGGGTGTGQTLNSVEIYNPSTNAWTYGAPMASARMGHSAVLLSSGKVFVARGQCSGSIAAPPELYDPIADTWTKTSPAPATFSNCPQGAPVTLPDRTVLIGGVIYDPSNDTWKSPGVFPNILASADTTLLFDGRVMFGLIGNTQDQLYDPITGNVSRLTLGMSRLVTLPDGKILGFDCCPPNIRSGSTVTPAITRLYDPKLDTWTLGVPLPGDSRPLPYQMVVMHSGDIFTAAPSPEIYHYPSQQPLPIVSNASIDHGDATSASILITGTGFLTSSMVSINTQPAVTTFLGANELLVFVPPSLLSSLGSVSLTVTNAGPGGGTSNSVFINGTVQLQSPAIASLTPNSGSPGTNITAMLSGTNLDGVTSVTFSGTGINATVQSGRTSTQVPLAITLSSDAALGPRSVTVTTLAGTNTVNGLFTVTFPAIVNTIPRPIRDVETGSVNTGYVILTPDLNSVMPLPTVTYGIIINGMVQAQAGIVPIPGVTDASLFVDVIPAINRNLGVAIVNPTNTTNQVSLTLQDQSGTAAGSHVFALILKPQQQTNNFIDELLGTGIIGNGFRGSLQLHSATPFWVLGLRFSGGAFSTLPVSMSAQYADVPSRTLIAALSANIPLPGAIGGPGALLIPQLAMGGGWATQIALVNSTGSAVSGRIDVFDTTGNPLAVKLNGSRQSTFKYYVPANASFVLAPRDENGQSPF